LTRPGFPVRVSFFWTPRKPSFRQGRHGRQGGKVLPIKKTAFLDLCNNLYGLHSTPFLYFPYVPAYADVSDGIDIQCVTDRFCSDGALTE
jgi:hypothetical protein